MHTITLISFLISLAYGNGHLWHAHNFLTSSSEPHYSTQRDHHPDSCNSLKTNIQAQFESAQFSTLGEDSPECPIAHFITSTDQNRFAHPDDARAPPIV